MHRAWVLAVGVLAASEGWAAPAFVQQAIRLGAPASLSMSLTAGNTVVLAIRGPSSFFPVTVSDTVGSSFVVCWTAVNGAGALSGTAAQLAYARVTTGGQRTISVSGSGSATGVDLYAAEFSGVTANYFWVAYYAATGGPADGRSVSAAADAVVFAHVVTSGSFLDGGTSFNWLFRNGTGTGIYGWLPAPADGDYPLFKPVTGAWITTLLSLGSRLVSPDAGVDSGVPPVDGGTADGGVSDAGTDGSVPGDGGLGADGGPAEDGGSASADGGAGTDAGVDGGSAREYRVGCDCAGVPAPAALALLVLVSWAGRRQRRP